MKILFYDLETYGHDFAANLGFIICGSYKWFDETKVHVIGHKLVGKRIEGIENDKNICKRLSEVIATADVVVTWNGTGFDHKFLQARMLHHGLGALKVSGHEDLLMTARKRLNMRPRSLGEVGRFLGCKEQKIPVSKDVWLAAGRGDVRAIKEWTARCKSDVCLLEEIFKILGPLSDTFPNRSGKPVDEGFCSFCGKKSLNRKGVKRALRHYRQQYQCTSCRKWQTGSPKRYVNGEAL